MAMFKPEPITLEEFEAMPKEDGINYELIDGLIMMSPRPNKRHSEIASRLAVKLMGYFPDESCFTYFETEVRHDNSVLIPDLSLFCKENKDLPLLVIEILSPNTRSRDLIQKPYHYQKIGIQEYWVIDPEKEIIMVFNLANESEIITYLRGQNIQSIVKPEIKLSVDDVFKKFIV